MVSAGPTRKKKSRATRGPNRPSLHSVAPFHIHQALISLSHFFSTDQSYIYITRSFTSIASVAPNMSPATPSASGRESLPLAQQVWEKLCTLLLPIVEAGYVPDIILRIGIRILLFLSIKVGGAAWGMRDDVVFWPSGSTLTSSLTLRPSPAPRITHRSTLAVVLRSNRNVNRRSSHSSRGCPLPSTHAMQTINTMRFVFHTGDDIFLAFFLTFSGLPLSVR